MLNEIYKSTFMKPIAFLVTSLILFFSISVNAQDGALLYGQNCASCHGAHLGGGNAASLVDEP